MERLRFGVYVRRASGLPDDIDSLVKVKVDGNSQQTYAIEEETNPEWNQLLTFEVKKANKGREKVKFKVVDSRRFRPAKTIGSYETQLEDLCKYNTKEEVTFQLHDKNKKLTKMTLCVSFYHAQPALEKPLRVLCATWNIGNAAPPKDLALWLKDCKKGVYDLIAVGAQESQYTTKEKTPGTGLGPINTRSLSGFLTGESSDLDEVTEQTSLLMSSTATTPTATPTSLTPTNITPVPTPTARGVLSNPEVPWPEQDGAGSLTPTLRPSPRKEELILTKETGHVSPFHTSKEIYEAIVAAEEVNNSTAGQAPASPGRAWNAELVQSITSLQQQGMEAVVDKLTQERGELEYESISLTTKVERGVSDEVDDSDSPWEGAAQPPEPAPALPPLPPKSAYGSKEDLQPSTPGGAGPESKVKYKKTTGAILKKIGHRIYYGSAALSFEDVVTEAVGEQYVLVDKKSMGQVRLLVFAHVDIRNAILWAESDSEATGVASVGRNKGGAGIALRVGNTSICFVSAHLAAHQSKLSDREKDYKEIVDGLNMDEFQMDVVTGYHHVLFMGDLNYRIDYKSQKTTHSSTPTQEEFDEMVQLIKDKQYAKLFADDQLSTEIKHENVFVGFKEAPINFAPTFKMLRNKIEEYDSKRSPAWCDRILALSTLPQLPAKFEEYYSVPELCTSDHKPVAAIVNLPVVVKTLAAGRLKTPDAPSFEIYISSLTLKQPLAKYSVDDSIMGPTLRIFSPAFDPKLATSFMYEAKLRESEIPGQASLRDPLSMKLLEGPVDEMEDDRLMVRVVSSIQGGRSSLGRTVIPFWEVVAHYRKNPTEPKDLDIRLLDNGVDVGRLEIKIQIRKWEPSHGIPLTHESSRDLSRIVPANPAPARAPTPSSTSQIYSAISNEHAAFATRANSITGGTFSDARRATHSQSLLGDEVPMGSFSSDSRTASASSAGEVQHLLDAEDGAETHKPASRLKRTTPHTKSLPSMLL